ncbi:MAG: NUDIX hydrolase [Phycisphaerales bacterium]|jgi:ADP-ribose pyrophosphatase|nr:NUDIX hydrolase [Phycisphaerales bacterium]
MPADDQPSAPTILSRRTLLTGKKYDYDELVIQPSRSTDPAAAYIKHVVRHPGAVVIVPVLDDGRIVLITNHRVTVGRALLELPAGTLERTGPGGTPEDPVACAGRELIEEAGYEAAELRHLAWYYTTPGLTDEIMHVVGARRLRHVGQRLEPYEDIRVVPLSPAEVMARLDAARTAPFPRPGDPAAASLSTLHDAKSIAALWHAQRAGWLPAS